MSKGTTHVLFGVLLSLIAIYLFAGTMTYTSAGLMLACAIAGSLFPDIDTRSKGRTLMYYLMIPAYAFMIYYRQLLMCLLIAGIGFLPLLCVHRGLFHRLWFISLCMVICLLSLLHIFPHYSYQILSGAFFFFMGACSHLWLDYGF